MGAIKVTTRAIYKGAHLHSSCRQSACAAPSLRFIMTAADLLPVG